MLHNENYFTKCFNISVYGRKISISYCQKVMDKTQIDLHISAQQSVYFGTEMNFTLT